MDFRRLILPLALAVMALPASADIVLLTNGRTLKVAGYQAVDETMELTLKGGGKIHLPLDRIERVVGDEVDDPVNPEPQIEVARVFPERAWTFHEESKPFFESKYDKTIVEAARKFNVDAALVSAVIKAESNYNPKVVSRKGARGLMQLMPATAKRFGVSNSFDPVANIYGGTKYLRWLLQTFEGNADLAVAAYNAGEGNVWKYEGVPPFRETREYIRRIARHFHASAASAPALAASR
jgi:hypothetical protein